MNKINLSGKVFSRLTVLEQDGHIGKKIAWKCLCACGNIKRASSCSLATGSVRSCGCLKKTNPNYVTHNMSRTPTYVSWKSMKTRCLSARHPHYRHYGGRGITVCDEWIASFEAFLSDMGERPHGTSLDRINNNLGYCKENCRWATASEQARDLKNSPNLRPPEGKKYTCYGSLLTISEMGELYGLSQHTVRQRLKRGETPERAVSKTRLSANQYFRL